MTQAQTKQLSKISLPVPGYAPVTLGFGEVYQGVRHKGIDFGVAEGTPVSAVLPGTILQSGFEAAGYGWYVLLLHADGSGSLYAHLRQQGLRPGTSVQKGATVGYSGNTGNSSGPHLHFEYRRQASYISTVVDPMQYFTQSIVQGSQQQAPQCTPLKSDLSIGAAQVVCDVANVRDNQLQQIGTVKKGQGLTLTGDKILSGGLVFYKALITREIWIAAHDGNVQIVDNIK